MKNIGPRLLIAIQIRGFSVNVQAVGMEVAVAVLPTSGCRTSRATIRQEGAVKHPAEAPEPAMSIPRTLLPSTVGGASHRVSTGPVLACSLEGRRAGVEQEAAISGGTRDAQRRGMTCPCRGRPAGLGGWGWRAMNATEAAMADGV